jgi:Methyltransferase domain
MTPPPNAADNTPALAARNPTHSSRRVNMLAHALNTDNYLEIGVWHGDSLFTVNMKNKIGVDPHFAFDKTKVDDANVTLVEEPSDLFFSKLPNNTEFDIVFLDGAHIFEQTYRDLCNALLYSKKRTVFLIDDVRPCDVYSTMPSWELACKARQEQGSFNGAWHGDVFKVIFAIHDFHLGLNYRTIEGAGNQQTLVWRSNLGVREPLYNSMEKISRLTYFDLVEHIDVLRCCTEDQAFAICLTELGIA